MNKLIALLAPLALLALCLPSNGYALEYVTIVKKAACTDIQFRGQLDAKHMVAAKYWTLRNGTHAALVDYPSNKVNNLRWSKPITAYLALKAPTDAQTNSFLGTMSSVKRHIKANLSCATFSGVNLPQVLNGNTWVFKDYVTNNQIPEFNASYQPTDKERVVIMLDGAANKKYIDDGYFPRIKVARSMIPGGWPAIADLPGIPTHSNIMLHDVLSTSTVDVYLLALTAHKLVPDSFVSTAMSYANSLVVSKAQASPGTRFVVSKPFGSLLGDSHEVVEESRRLVAKGVPVITAAGNRNIIEWADKEKNLNEISIGWTDGMVVKSTYGDTAPDLLIESKDRDIYSSDATVITAGKVAEMLNICPKATPKNIKAVLCLTAKKLPPSPSLAINKKNSYVDCGIIKFKDAMDLLMDTTCGTTPPPPPPVGCDFGVNKVPVGAKACNLVAMRENSCVLNSRGYEWATSSKDCGYAVPQYCLGAFGKIGASTARLCN